MLTISKFVLVESNDSDGRPPSGGQVALKRTTPTMQDNGRDRRKSTPNRPASEDAEDSQRDRANDPPREGEDADTETRSPDENTPPRDELECRPLEECFTPSRREGAENHVYFHRPHLFGRVARVPQELDEPSAPRAEVSCVPISSGTLSLIADLNIVQTWCFQDLTLDDLASTLALAPAETYEYSVKRTQRSKVDRDVMRSSESVEKFENSIMDKEVMNVTRTSSRNLNWEVSANGSIRTGVYRAGVSGEVSGGTERTAKEALEQLEKSTRKSSSQLKLLQKLEVGRTTETVVESEEVRTVTNPYRDRPLQLNFYELSKHYRVINRLDPDRPYDYALVLDVDDMRFDRSFVLENQDFLKEYVLDRELWDELQHVLQRGAVRPGSDTAQWFARKALAYLFEVGNVFQVDVPGPVDRTEEEWNDPALSFIGRWNRSAYNDSLSQNFGSGFAAINVYYKIYLEEVDGDPESVDEERLIELALTLADYVGPLWNRLSKGERKKLLDDHDHTEVIRRLPGFLSLVEGGVRPAVRRHQQTGRAPPPAESEDGGGESDTEELPGPSVAGSPDEVKANSVIARMVEHVGCNKSYYIKAYLTYVFEITSGFALRDTLRGIERRADVRGSSVAEIFEHLDANAAYQDGHRYVVPVRRDVDAADFERVMFEALDEAAGGVSPEVRSSIEEFEGDVDPIVIDDVVLPADGYYLEAVEGADCMTGDLLERDGSVVATIDVEASGD